VLFLCKTTLCGISIAAYYIICILLAVKSKWTWTLPSSPSQDRKSLHHQVAGRIGALIGNGSLAPGTVLPNENELGNELGVSRTVLREAMKVLGSKGLVEVRRKTGTRVRPDTDWNMLDAEVLAWFFAGTKIPSTLSYLLDLRRLIEPAAARMAAELGTQEEVKKIQASYLQMEAMADDVAASVEADLSFHLALLEATHNPFLRSFGALIQSALRASFRFTNSNHDLYLQSLKLHKKVCDAVTARKGNLAEKSMMTVLSQTSEDIVQQSASLSLKKTSKRPKQDR
jgi:DNA-binding FadR family transcriptional regulator